MKITSRLRYHLLADSVALLVISGSAAASNLTWQGNGTTNTWDVNSSLHWNNNTAKFLQLDTVTFDDIGSNAPAVDLVGVLQPSAINVTGTKDYTFGGSGMISGSGGLTKSGTGVLTINSGAHDFSGPVSLGGTTIITALRGTGQASSLGAGNGIGLEGMLRYTGSTTSTNRSITLNGTGGILDISDLDATVSLTGAIAGSGKLSKTGLGELVMPGSNGYSGGTDILGGLLRISSNDKALGDGFAVSIDNNATLDVNGVTGLAATRRYDVSIGAGGGRILNLGAGATSNPIYRLLTLVGNLIIETSSRYDLTGGTVDGAGVTVNGNGFSLTKRGSGETWWAPNPGATIGDIIVDAGTFGVRSSGNLGDDSRSIIVNAAGQLSTFSAVTNSKSIILNGGLLASSSANSTWTGSVTLIGTGTTNRIGVLGTGTGVTLTGQVTGPGGLEKTSGGTLDLRNSTNNWAGSTLISGGTLVASAVGALPTTTKLLMIGGALELPTGAHNVAGLSGPTGTVKGAGTLVLNGEGPYEPLINATFGGTIADRVNLTVAPGSGTLILTGASTTSGTTTVSGGTLAVQGSISGSTIVNGGSLKGRGTVGPLLMTAGAVAPGLFQFDSGILNAGNTVFNGGSLSVDLNGPAAGSGYDQLNITGTVNLGSKTPLYFYLFYDPVDSVDTFVIVNNDGAEPITGFFAGLPEGALTSASSSGYSQRFRITYRGGVNGNDVVLLSVPEPGSLVTLFGGFATLLGFQRLRRRAG